MNDESNEMKMMKLNENEHEREHHERIDCVWRGEKTSYGRKLDLILESRRQAVCQQQEQT